jgi:tetratricopeptide (TPR) repeat protein
MSSDERPKPMAEGTFSKTPFSHILVYLYGKKASGSLDVHTAKDAVTVYFREGMPAKVRSSFKGKGLGQVLLDLGRISQEQLRECQKEMTTAGGYAGEILLRRGFVDAPALVRGLRGQMLLKLVDVFGMVDAQYEFYEKVNLLVGDGPDEVLPLDPYPILMAGARAHGARMKLDHVLDSLQGRWISVKTADPLRRLKLSAPEQDLCRELLARPKTMDELLQAGRHNRQVIRSVVYVLLITKELEVSDTPPASGQPSIAPGPRNSLESVPPPPIARQVGDPEVRRARDAIVEKAARIANQNYYEMLEVPLGSPVEEVRKSFFRLAKSYHPDRANKDGLEDLKETLEYVFSNLSEAHSTLLDPDTRAEYGDAISAGIKRTSVMPPSSGEEEVRDALEAEKLYQKGLVLMRREQYAKGLALVDRARELNPAEGEYLATWAKLQSLQRAPTAPVEDLISHLRRAEELNPNSEKVHIYMGQLLKRSDRTAEARSHFQKALDINPRNIEAARELRIMEMRQSKESEKKKGILGRFLK